MVTGVQQRGASPLKTYARSFLARDTNFLDFQMRVRGRDSRLKMLERLIGEMKAKGDVWMATYKDVADWTRGRLESQPPTG